MISGFQIMWILVMFDLPTEDSESRKCYTQFRNELLKDGFVMMQYSVYMRLAGTREIAERHIRHVESCLPPDGEVRILPFTDKQFACMKVFICPKRKQANKQTDESAQWEQLQLL